MRHFNRKDRAKIQDGISIIVCLIAYIVLMVGLNTKFNLRVSPPIVTIIERILNTEQSQDCSVLN